MDAKERLQLQVLRIMSQDLSEEQLNRLKNSMSAVMWDYSVNEIETTEIKEYEGDKSEELMQYFAVSKLACNTSKDTITQYLMAVEQLCSFTHKRVDEIAKEDVRYFLVIYAKNNNVKPSTMESKRRYLSSFFNFLYLNKKIKDNPMANIEPVRCKKALKKPLSEEELTKIKLSCDNIRDLALIVFMLETGIRVSECANLSISDLDFDRKECKILGKGNKERIVYFTGKSSVLLKKYFDSRADINSNLLCCCNVPLFTISRQPYSRLNKFAIESVLKKIGKQSGVTRLHPHLLRATFATELANKDMPLDMIAKLLGHSNMSTLRHYVLRDYNDINYSYRKIGSVA